ncbi:MAG: hypothetical protein QY325_11785 [Flavobacteriales bacterium]|nr:MAG: hypothetical protein QY325_11785 [Flavobacteriales bacterium]
MMLLALASVHALAQQPVMDTTTMNAQADTVSDRLGARFVVGGIYAQGDRFRIYKNYYGGFGSEKLLDFSAEFWGMQVGAHLPVGAQVDFIAMAQYTMFPGWSFTTSVPDYTAPRLNFEWQMVDRTVRVPGSTFIGLRFGIQVFTRSNNLGDLLSATRGLQRQFWRRRVCKLPRSSAIHCWR